MSYERTIRAEVTAIEMLEPDVYGGPRRYAVTVQAIDGRDSTCLSFETATRPEIDAPVAIIVRVGSGADDGGTQ